MPRLSIIAVARSVLCGCVYYSALLLIVLGAFRLHADVPKTEIRLDPIIGFEENRGQGRPDIRFILRSNLYITGPGFTIAPDQIHAAFGGGNPAAPMSTSDTLPGVANFISGTDQSKWISGIRRFREVKFTGVYSGIDVVYKFDSNGLHILANIGPNGDPSSIRLRFTGATVESTLEGAVLLRAARRRVLRIFDAGAKWKVIEPNEVQLERVSTGRIIQLPLGFQGGAATLAYSVDATGAILTAGRLPGLITQPLPPVAETVPSADFCGRFVDDPVPCEDAFVAKYSPAGTLQFITYIRGSTNDRAEEVRADRNGDIWVGGATDSTDFPLTRDAAHTRFAGPAAKTGSSLMQIGDLFLLKLSGTTGLPLYSTYVGGPDADRMDRLLVDTAGNAYLSGAATRGLPTTPGAFRASPCDVCSFAAKWTASGALVYLTYLPSWASSQGVDSSGAFYFGGGARADFPVTPGAFDTSFNGGPNDAYVAKLNPSGTAFVYATFFGGAGLDYTSDLAVDSEGNVWFTGPVFPPSDSPGELAGWQYGYFLAKLDASGSGLLVHRSNIGAELAVDSQDNLFLSSSSAHGSKTIANPGGSLTSSCSDTYLAKLNKDGVLVYAQDAGKLIGFGASGQPVVFGKTNPLLDTPIWMLDLSVTPRQFLSCMLGAASMRDSKQIVPGEIVALVGSGLGPQTGVTFQLDRDGRVPRELAGTRVRFNGEPAPILYAQNGQVNAIAPFTLTPGTPVTVEVEYSGSRTRVTATVESFRPQIFTLDGSGSGQAAMLNQDGTINSPQNPARTGSVVSLFLMGAGQTSPILREGEVARSIEAKPLSNIRIALAGPVATWLELLYAGPAPGLVNSVTQVNVRLPGAVPAFAGGTALSMPIFVEANGRSFYQDARIAIQ